MMKVVIEKKRKCRDEKDALDESPVKQKKKRIHGKSHKKIKSFICSYGDKGDQELEELYNEIDHVGGDDFVDEPLEVVVPFIHDADFVD